MGEEKGLHQRGRARFAKPSLWLAFSGIVLGEVELHGIPIISLKHLKPVYIIPFVCFLGGSDVLLVHGGAVGLSSWVHCLKALKAS